MDISSDLSLGTSLWNFIPPMILLVVAMSACMGIYVVLFKKVLPRKIYNFFLGPVALIGFYIWAVPMNIGFYEFFRAMF
ncbi:hypothetical protein ACIQXW_08440 [Lysinibacillus sp. NPDC097162]|uniref:hypothetical protein n=1 Tax=Lysinibacillus sp. NPDC097162 TaxID=3364140 RepID=UPI00380C15CB